MRTIAKLLSASLILALIVTQNGSAAENAEKTGPWRLRIDIGGVMPEDAELTEFDGPLGDGNFKLDAGFQFDMALEYKLTPWLGVGPELGITFNGVDSIGGWSYDSSLFQFLMMANAVVEYPTEGPLVPFAGAGIGGVLSSLSFWGDTYDTDYYGYWEPDGVASDCVTAFQAFGGLRYRVGENFELGVIYRFLATRPRHWDVEWWNGADFDIGTDSMMMHSFCLVFSGTF